LKGCTLSRKRKQPISESIYQITPKTQGQRDYWDALNDQRINYIAVTGFSGSGKTILACQYAAQQYLAGKFNKIIICRSLEPVSQENGCGYLKGDAKEKLSPWLAPILQHLQKFLPDLEREIALENVEMIPVDMMRGRSFDCCVVICTEAQNLSMPMLKCLLTRPDADSLLILDGDLDQTDRLNSETENLYTELLKLPSFAWIEMAEQDVVRNPGNIVEIVKIFKKLGY